MANGASASANGAELDRPPLTAAEVAPTTPFDFLRDAVRLAPKDDRVHFNLANSLHAAGQAEEAIREYRTAIALEPENADAHFNLGVLLGPKGRLDEAIVHLRRTIDIRPRNADAHRNLAIAYGLQGKLDEAIEHARAAVRIQPDAIAMRQQLENLLAARKAR
jgi:tetratricopeptide (TPR) repeat protein